MSVKQYDPKKITVIVGVQAISGFADGSFVEVELDEDAFTKVVGADGEVARAKSNNFAGNAKLTLLQTSKSNDYLSGLHQLDRASGTGVVAILIRDALGTTLYASESAWVKKLPNTVFSKGIESREWTIDCGQLDAVVGGA